MKNEILGYSFIVVCGLLSAGSVLAEDASLANLSDKQRIQRLERMMSSDVLREQTQTMQTLRQEISALREQIEQQDYELESMKQRQRNLYLDMDRRINNAEAGGSNSGRAAAPVPPPNTSKSIAAIPVVAGDSDGQEAYSQAFSLLKEGQYEQSIKAFEAFKASYPNSKYADNAQYWLGEANYVSRDYKRALTEFQQLIAQYPESSKNSGARLKIGYVYFELKNWSAAREALQQVITLYPDTTVAKKANERLQRMKREGH
ncbi:MAG: tol-pal system protein YbgF [Gammaproteobacteria bacterium]|jgi:tol-pal system protein YbgF|nr:tol-pal system protein YbgF [Gammaproteobacteria bacterium]MCW8941855.1 tol-pal system protein YbgF [Gammaproteobacteria bacterium]